MLRLLPQSLGIFRLALGQHLETSLLLQEVSHFARGPPGIENQWILTCEDALGVVAMAMSYGNVYVASVAMGAKDEHTLKAFLEAEAYDGPSLIIAYSHCIAHGINMTTAMSDQKIAVDSGQWLL
jgi:pyruvate/2-oxoacid:ferredoxin oxidoreductase beta subunit